MTGLGCAGVAAAPLSGGLTFSLQATAKSIAPAVSAKTRFKNRDLFCMRFLRLLEMSGAVIGLKEFSLMLRAPEGT
jgi:hypothetical protein